MCELTYIHIHLYAWDFLNFTLSVFLLASLFFFRLNKWSYSLQLAKPWQTWQWAQRHPEQDVCGLHLRKTMRYFHSFTMCSARQRWWLCFSALCSPWCFCSVHMLLFSHVFWSAVQIFFFHSLPLHFPLNFPIITRFFNFCFFMTYLRNFECLFSYDLNYFSLFCHFFKDIIICFSGCQGCCIFLKLSWISKRNITGKHANMVCCCLVHDANELFLKSVMKEAT